MFNPWESGTTQFTFCVLSHSARKHSGQAISCSKVPTVNQVLLSLSCRFPHTAFFTTRTKHSSQSFWHDSDQRMHSISGSRLFLPTSCPAQHEITRQIQWMLSVSVLVCSSGPQASCLFLPWRVIVRLVCPEDRKLRPFLLNSLLPVKISAFVVHFSSVDYHWRFGAKRWVVLACYYSLLIDDHKCGFSQTRRTIDGRLNTCRSTCPSRLYLSHFQVWFPSRSVCSLLLLSAYQPLWVYSVGIMSYGSDVCSICCWQRFRCHYK